MASRTTSSIALFLALNVLFFILTSACGYCPTPTPKPKPKPKPKPTPSPAPSGKCPVDTLKFAACSDVLKTISVEIGKPPKKPCCSLVEGLADDEAALCLCTALKANVLGVNLNVPISLSLLVNYCGKKVPDGFQCP
ncbi:hypothetical protein OPV22_001565 [Ensete ventricosum]|nr:hypothetical protein OPV22_001565 [Ensete ventricosum]